MDTNKCVSHSFILPQFNDLMDSSSQRECAGAIAHKNMFTRKIQNFHFVYLSSFPSIFDSFLPPLIHLVSFLECLLLLKEF